MTQAVGDLGRASGGFEAEADAALDAVRASLGAVVQEIRPPVRREPELRAALGLDKKLSWSVFRAATATDSKSVASVLPGRRALERILEAAGGRGVPAGVLDQARRAFARYEETVGRHARRRGDFEAMVADMAPGEKQEAFAARHRVAAFRANAVLWGRQARVSLGTTILHPSAGPELLDSARLTAALGLHRTRRDVALYSVWQTRRLQRGARESGTLTEEPVTWEPIDPREDAPGAIGLLQDFCSHPLPRFEASTGGDGRVCHRLVAGDEVGAAAAIDLSIGRVTRACAQPPAPGAPLSLSGGLATPVELMLADVLIHRSVWDESVPEARVYAPPLDGSPDVHEIDRLSMRVPVEHLGLGSERAWTLDVPRYDEMLSYTLGRLGWDAREFRVFRCRVEHPILHAYVRLSFDPGRG